MLFGLKRSAVDVGIDVCHDRIVLGEVVWGRDQPVAVGRWSEFIRRSPATMDESNLAAQEWVRATLRSWKCRPRAVAITVPDAWVSSTRLAAPEWLVGDDLVQALGDDLRTQNGVDVSAVAFDFSAVARDLGGAPKDESQRTEGARDVDVFWLAEDLLAAQSTWWGDVGAPLRRVEPQSVALARGVSYLQAQGAARLLLDVQAAGVLGVWIGAQGAFARTWVIIDHPLDPPASPVVGLLPVTAPDDAAWWMSTTLEEIKQQVLRWLGDGDGEPLQWCVRGEDSMAQAIRAALPRTLGGSEHHVELTQLSAAAWPVAAAAWGVALVREA
jgi:hypothetical protein